MYFLAYGQERKVCNFKAFKAADTQQTALFENVAQTARKRGGICWVFLQLFCSLRPSAPAAGIEASGRIIAGVCSKEIVGISLMKDGNVTALLFLYLRRKKGDG